MRPDIEPIGSSKIRLSEEFALDLLTAHAGQLIQPSTGREAFGQNARRDSARPKLMVAQSMHSRLGEIPYPQPHHGGDAGQKKPDRVQTAAYHRTVVSLARNHPKQNHF